MVSQHAREGGPRLGVHLVEAGPPPHALVVLGPELLAQLHRAAAAQANLHLLVHEAAVEEERARLWAGHEAIDHRAVVEDVRVHHQAPAARPQVLAGEVERVERALLPARVVQDVDAPPAPHLREALLDARRLEADDDVEPVDPVLVPGEQGVEVPVQ